MRWLIGRCKQLASLSETLLPTKFGDVLELDELWTFGIPPIK